MNPSKVWKIGVATVIGIGGLFVNENLHTASSPANFLTQAEARIGRPWTPFSIAGVARRTARRAVWAGAVAGGAYYGYGYPYSYGSGYDYPYSYRAGYGYDYPYSYGAGYGYSYPYSYASSYPSYYGYGSAYPYYGGSYAYGSLGWGRRWWW